MPKFIIGWGSFGNCMDEQEEVEADTKEEAVQLAQEMLQEWVDENYTVMAEEID